MIRIIKIFLVYLLYGFSPYSSPQSVGLVMNQDNVDCLYKKIHKTYDKSSCHNSDSFIMFTIYNYEIRKGFDLTNLTNSDSLKVLKPSMQSLNFGKRIPICRSIFYDVKNSILGSSNGFVFSCANKENEHTWWDMESLIKESFKHNIEVMISLTGVDMPVYFGFASNGKIWVFDLRTPVISVYKLEDYILLEKMKR